MSRFSFGRSYVFSVCEVDNDPSSGRYYPGSLSPFCTRKTPLKTRNKVCGDFTSEELKSSNYSEVTGSPPVSEFVSLWKNSKRSPLRQNY